MSRAREPLTVTHVNALCVRFPHLFHLLPCPPPGVLVAQGSLQIGIDTANSLLAMVEQWQQERDLEGRPRIAFPRPDHLNRRWRVLMLFFTLSALMWTGAAAGTAVDTGSEARRKLFLSILVGPFGVWTRWYLARLNGRGVGIKHHLKWLPVGTLVTNLVAAWLEAALSAINRWVNDFPPSHIQSFCSIPGLRVQELCRDQR